MVLFRTEAYFYLGARPYTSIGKKAMEKVEGGSKGCGRTGDRASILTQRGILMLSHFLPALLHVIPVQVLNIRGLGHK